jgi:hypothetical protein
MMHAKRRFRVVPVERPEDLARLLVEQTWTLCTGFSLEQAGRRYLFLNDAISEDGAQEYAVFRQTPDGWRQVESVTFSWCTVERAIEIVQSIAAGGETPFGVYHLQLDHPDGPCPLCA